jgi:FtsH-binding integral membrane protein
MLVLGWLLLVIGFLLGIYWRVRFLATAYRQSLWWLVGCVLIPLVDWLFLFLNWKIARKPFGLSLAWLLLAGLGGLMVELAKGSGHI